MQTHHQWDTRSRMWIRRMAALVHFGVSPAVQQGQFASFSMVPCCWDLPAVLRQQCLRKGRRGMQLQLTMTLSPKGHRNQRADQRAWRGKAPATVFCEAQLAKGARSAPCGPLPTESQTHSSGMVLARLLIDGKVCRTTQRSKRSIWRQCRGASTDRPMHLQAATVAPLPAFAVALREVGFQRSQPFCWTNAASVSMRRWRTRIAQI
mmetsp:Transcript_34758/g.68603  ORF Transcript_34758/g.68603 Transcript_34758/m.68603 type:complete len:207 (+) Transcript_34758:485-1105(+)